MQKFLVLVTFVGMVFVNYLANALPINGLNTGQISDSFPNFFAPAGITFAIWGLIYLLLGIYTVYQLGITKKGKSEGEANLAQKVNNWFILSSIASTFWIFAWHYKIVWASLLLIVTMLFSLIKIADLINGGKKVAGLIYRIPFGVYFGWLTVATIANIAIWLVSVRWDRFGLADQVWMILVLVVGMVIGIMRTTKDRNLAYGLVFLWAYLGILYRHVSEAGFAGRYPAVIISVLLCLVTFLVADICIFWKNKK